MTDFALPSASSCMQAVASNVIGLERREARFRMTLTYIHFFCHNVIGFDTAVCDCASRSNQDHMREVINASSYKWSERFSALEQHATSSESREDIMASEEEVGKKEWSQEESEKLIGLYREEACLWDIFDDNYRDRNAKDTMP